MDCGIVLSFYFSAFERSNIMMQEKELAHQAFNLYMKDIDPKAYATKTGLRYIGAITDHKALFQTTVIIGPEDEYDEVEYRTYEIVCDTNNNQVSISMLKPKKTAIYSTDLVHYNEHERIRAAVIEGREQQMTPVEIAFELGIKVDVVEQIIEQEGI